MTYKLLMRNTTGTLSLRRGRGTSWRSQSEDASSEIRRISTVSS